jgi:hypothetical protein
VTAGHRPPARGAVLAAGLAAAAVLGLGGPGDAHTPAPRPHPSPAAAQVRAEADAMVADGVPADDPKVRMLEHDARALDDAAAGPPRADPGDDPAAVAARADAGEVARDPAEARARTEEMRSPQPAERGAVLCEPVPVVLAAQEVEGASCFSVPVADGSSRYVAVTPAGTVRVVAFGAGGDVRRLPDTGLPAGAGADEVTAGPDGTLTVERPGKPDAQVELG